MKTFELENLYTTEEHEFLPHKDIEPGAGLMLQINPDLLTMEYFDRMDIFFNDWLKEINGKSKTAGKKTRKQEKELEAATAKEREPNYEVELTKLDMRHKAMILGGKPGDDDPRNRLIAAWGLIEKGQPVPVSYEQILKFSNRLINSLFEFCKTAANPEKKTEESSEDGS